MKEKGKKIISDKGKWEEEEEDWRMEAQRTKEKKEEKYSEHEKRKESMSDHQKWWTK